MGSRSDKGHAGVLCCRLVSLRPVTLRQMCWTGLAGVRGEYRYGRKKASEIVEMEEDCPRSGAFMYSCVRVGNAKDVREQIWSRVHLAGTRVPDTENVGEQYC